MKRNSPVVALTILAALLLALPVLLAVCGFGLPAQFGQTFLGALPDKLELLRQSQGSRIILVGGSSVPFSVNSPWIREAFPEYTVVDLGLYADIGTPVMLDLLEEELRPGDIVILSPEQDAQALSLYFSGESLWQAMDGHWELLSRLPSHRYEKLAASFASFAGKKAYYALRGQPELTGIYRKSSFNAFGDIDSPERGANIMAGGYDPNQPIRFDEDMIGEDFTEYLNAFAARCRQASARVCYRFGPMNQAALADDEGKLDAFYDALSAKLDFPILGDPHRSVMDRGWFYDTNFHLNASGAAVFTKYLIEDLKILLGDTSPTRIELPPMPELTRPVPMDGDNSCLDCFTYAETEDGLVIDGLTERGRSAETLVIPVSRGDRPIVGISETLFAGSTVLRELTVQENIGVLYDGMFRSCTGLRKLILTGGPGCYTVGDGLRDGADFRICVPETFADSYRRHYLWQKYGSFIVGY
ncbi:MAG: hypothetical protein PUB93_07930 [Firmicutes bacterium]|nr:hypothetical protein [Bacillota bacterium]